MWGPLNADAPESLSVCSAGGQRLLSNMGWGGGAQPQQLALVARGSTEAHGMGRRDPR